MARADRKLLDSLENEERIEEEPLVLPVVEFDPMRKISSLLEEAGQNTNLINMTGVPVDMGLLATYLVRNINAQEIKLYLGPGVEDATPKIVLVDIAKGLFPKFYDPSEPFEDIALQIVCDLYSDFFQVVGRWLYFGEENMLDEDEEIDKPIEEDENVFQRFKRGDVEPTIAAAALSPHLEGLEPRLEYVNDIKELKYLIGAKIYCEMIKDEELKRGVMKNILDPGFPLCGAFYDSFLTLHQDFINKVNE